MICRSSLLPGNTQLPLPARASAWAGFFFGQRGVGHGRNVPPLESGGHPQCGSVFAHSTRAGVGMSNMVSASLRALALKGNHKLTRGDARMLLLAAELLDARDADATQSRGREADAHRESISRGALLSVARAELRGLLQLLDDNV